jgi:two-component system chemotaxis response regulator CheB
MQEHAVTPGGDGRGAQGQSYREVVVVGASAGGVEALSRLVHELPPELPAAVLVVLHVLATGTSVLPSILSREGRLVATSPLSGEPLERGHIYVAPPDWHLLVADGGIDLTRGPRENGHRPAIDPLFRSAGRVYGDRVIAVILSGSLDDGAAGLRFVKERGGVTIVQDPGDALYTGMPESAISSTKVDHVVPVNRMAALICRLLEEPIEERAEEEEPRPDEEEMTIISPREHDIEGEPSALTCPECGGALWERQEGPLVRFECRVGHAFSPESLATEQSQALEAAMWAALRSLEERADLLRRMARRTGEGTARKRFEARAVAADDHAALLRRALVTLRPPGEAEPVA